MLQLLGEHRHALQTARARADSRPRDPLVVKQVAQFVGARLRAAPDHDAVPVLTPALHVADKRLQAVEIPAEGEACRLYIFTGSKEVGARGKRLQRRAAHDRSSANNSSLPMSWLAQKENTSPPRRSSAKRSSCSLYSASTRVRMSLHSSNRYRRRRKRRGNRRHFAAAGRGRTRPQTLAPLQLRREFARDRLRALVGGRVAEGGQLPEQRVLDAFDLFRVDDDVRRGDDVDARTQRQALARDKVIRFDLFHRVAEKIDAHGVLRADGEDVENVAAQGELARALHVRRARIAQPDQQRGKGGKVDLLPLPQTMSGDVAGKELQKALHVAHGRRAPFCTAHSACRRRKSASLETASLYSSTSSFAHRSATSSPEKPAISAAMRAASAHCPSHTPRGPSRTPPRAALCRRGNAENRRRRAEAEVFF